MSVRGLSKSRPGATCPTDPSGPEIVPIAGNSTFHQVAIIIGTISMLLAVLISLTLILRHATHFSVSVEQKQEMRIVFTIPIFAIISLLSIIFENAAIYLTPFRDLYEAFAFVAVFQLICAFVHPNDTERLAYLYFNDHAVIYRRAPSSPSSNSPSS